MQMPVQEGRICKFMVIENEVGVNIYAMQEGVWCLGLRLCIGILLSVCAKLLLARLGVLTGGEPSSPMRRCTLGGGPIRGMVPACARKLAMVASND